MDRRSSIALGDLVRAVRMLDVRDPADVAGIAALLGLVEGGGRSHPSPSATPPAGGGSLRPAESATTTAMPGALTPVRPADSMPSLEEVEPAAAVVEALPVELSARQPPREVPSLDALLTAPRSVEPLNDAGLFDSRWQRGILTSLISTEAAGNTIDVDRVIDRLAAGVAINALPTLPIYTTRKGLQVLLDIGSGMELFAEDAENLEDVLRHTAGDDSVNLLRFDRTPASGAGPGTKSTWRPYATPAAGVPIVVVSDFGLAGARDQAGLEQAWAPIAAAAATGACPLIALTPFPAVRWPGWLTSAFEVVHWDRATNAALARRTAVAALRRWRG